MRSFVQSFLRVFTEIALVLFRAEVTLCKFDQHQDHAFEWDIMRTFGLFTVIRDPVINL